MMGIETYTSGELRPLRRREYDALVKLGVFDEERIELLHGQLVRISPQGAPHAETVRRLMQLLFPALVGRAIVQCHLPLATTDDSEPEPDVSIIAPGDYKDDHPTTAWLVIEVADSSLKHDRNIKTRLYARAGIPEYWLVDLQHRLVEVYRKPLEDRYSELITHDASATLHIGAFPDVTVPIADFLPQR